MKIETTPIEGLLVITPNIFKDERGYFFESYSQKKLAEFGLSLDFVQHNQSMSSKGTLRGLHFQAPPFDQGKLVRVIKGSVLDIAVDIRKSSPTYGKYHSCLLTEANNVQFWVPSGFAHGFLALEDNTIFSYMCTNYYDKASEAGLLWNDKDVAINWQLLNFEPILSDKDKELPAFKDFKSPF